MRKAIIRSLMIVALPFIFVACNNQDNPETKRFNAVTQQLNEQAKYNEGINVGKMQGISELGAYIVRQEKFTITVDGMEYSYKLVKKAKTKVQAEAENKK